MYMRQALKKRGNYFKKSNKLNSGYYNMNKRHTTHFGISNRSNK